ncbi:MAG: zinc ribbon domain-containing protein [Desulfonauticus sp.]|nr:zinc ribbon domain-containing protein [Desulfonauticus sp.]
MPIYEYQCDECGHVFEEWQKNFSEQKVVCPVCNGETHRLISSTSFILKGSGWYVTDYSRKSANNGAASAKNSSGQTANSCSTSSGGCKKNNS